MILRGGHHAVRGGLTKNRPWHIHLRPLPLHILTQSASRRSWTAYVVPGLHVHHQCASGSTEDLRRRLAAAIPGEAVGDEVVGEEGPDEAALVGLLHLERGLVGREWGAQGLSVRVVAVRSKDRPGKQLYLWEGVDWTVQTFLTNDFDDDADELARGYDGRAGVEPLIGDLKGAWGIGKIPSADFNANHAALLLKLLTHNLLRRFVLATAPALAAWRALWLRRALIVVPGRFGRSGRSPRLRLARRPHLRN